MINLELPKRLKAGANQAHQAAAEIFRPISRKYDLKEHARPVELDTMASLVEGMADAARQWPAPLAAEVTPRRSRTMV